MASPHILILGPSWIGDMVLAQSLFKVIKTLHPEAIIEVAAPGWTLPLLERMPEIEASIALPFKHGQLALGERFRFGKQLREHGYTQAILLTNSLKSAVLPFAARIPRRTGFLGEYRFGLLNDVRPLNRQALPRTVDRFVALGLEPDEQQPDYLPSPRLTDNHQHALLTLQHLGHAAPNVRVLGLCPGAEYGPAKRWPAPYFAETAKHALAQGWEVWLFGSQKDMPVTGEINALTDGKCFDLGGKTTLDEAIDLMSLTTSVVSNDSGLMHIAAALDKPLVAVYGSSDPHHTPPMSEKAFIAYLGLSCGPCFKRECPLGHLNCLRQLTPALINEQLDRVGSAQAIRP
jgi:heptosyltransferase II